MTMNSNLVSVIIPIYNAENTLRKCIESVIQQNYAPIEIILVNDGSTDRSAEICDQFAQDDNRIVLVNQPNTGVSTARNTGLKHAHGSLCCFLDSDDWIDTSHITNLVHSIEGADIAITGYTKETPQNAIACQLKSGYYDLRNIHGESILDFFINGHIHPCWNKMFKTKIITDNRIEFKSNISISEDTLFCLDYLMHCDSMQILDTYTYHYFVDSAQSSLSNRFYPNIFEIYEKVFYSLSTLLKRGNCPDNLAEEILVQTIYPQLYSCILKLSSVSNLSCKDKRKFLIAALNLDYSKFVFKKEMKYISSAGERLILTLIHLRQYGLLGVITKCLSKRN